MNCPMCNVEMKLIPAGVSKTSGKHYKAFYSCPDCKETLNAEQEIRESKIPPKPLFHKANGEEAFIEGKEKNTRFMVKGDIMVALINRWNDVTMIDDMFAIFDKAVRKVFEQ